VRRHEEVLAGIRAARDAHYAEREAYERAAKKAGESLRDPAASA
jgi:hypothetical protein